MGDFKPMSGMRKAQAGETLTRWVRTRPPSLRGATRLAAENAKTTMHPGKVLPVGKNMLVSGHNSIKLGRDVRVGSLKGYWIYSLKLTERKTCPSSCKNWHECYGNNMPFANRYDHTDYEALTASLKDQIDRLLAVRGRKGIIIRLHDLGDFFSVQYVNFWFDMLLKHQNLVIWGYTAHVQGSEIGAAIQKIKLVEPERFRIRWSDRNGEDSTITIKSPADCPDDSFVCPEQTGKQRSDDTYVNCALCAACWESKARVAFVEHG